MARTKFMQRIFSAQDNEESLVLDQISNDIDAALENDGLETQEYNIDKLSPSQVEVHDKVNNEDTIIDIADGEFSMRAKTYSDIKNADEFRKYAHTVMKNAHGDDYSEEATDKVVDDLIKDNPNADWGELIGRLTSNFSKSFSEKKDNLRSFSEAKSFSEIGACVMKSKDGGYYVASVENEKDWDRIESYKKEGDKLVKKCGSTKEADDYIDSKGWDRYYSNNLKNFSEAAQRLLKK